MSETTCTVHGWPITPTEEMTLENARMFALAVIPESWPAENYRLWLAGSGGGGTPGGRSYAVGGYVGTLGWPLKQIRPDQIAIWWSHDPERRVYVFSAKELWDEVHSRVVQTVMSL